MRIAVLSGKGGTGKTFLSVNLAKVIGRAAYADCDVEEPNGALFLKPEITETKPVNVMIPEFQKEKCIGCKQCVEFCAYHALAFVKGTPLLFPEVCHSCGGCLLVCKEQAVVEKEKKIGELSIGHSQKTEFYSGVMNVLEASGVPIIRALLKNIPEDLPTVIDCPPGSGCMVMSAIQSADYCVLVAEPTEFGRHNLSMVYELVKKFHKPVGVVMNKYIESENPCEAYVKENQIPILAKIPYSKRLAKLNALGELAVVKEPTIKAIFETFYQELLKKVNT